MTIRLTAKCRWPLCGIGRVELLLTMRADDSKPEAVKCPLCRKELAVIAGVLDGNE